MNIAINCRFLIKDRLEGIGRFTYEVFKRVCEQHPEHHFHLIFDRPIDPAFVFGGTVTTHCLSPPARHPLLWYWWFEKRIPNLLLKIQADLFVSPDGYCSLASDGKQLMVIHDLAFEHFPEHVPSLASRYYRYFTPKYAARADRIVAVSNATKKNIITQYEVAADKIDLVFNAPNELFRPLSTDEKTKTKEKYTDGQSYFIYVGSMHPRKNVARLIQAFDMFKAESGSTKKLVLAGRFAWKSGNAKQAYESSSYRADIITTGHIEGGQLARLVASAEALVYPSLFEGFGIPIVEAMQAETPVITSNCSSMVEVAADAALLVDPTAVDSIAEALQIIENGSQSTQLIRKGLLRATEFSWQRSADQMWKAMIKTIE